MRVSTVLFIACALFVPTATIAQVAELKGPLNCSSSETGTGSTMLPGEARSLEYLVDHADEIVYGKFMSANMKCLAKKTLEGYELVPVRVVKIDTSAGSVFLSKQTQFFEFVLNFGRLPQGLDAGEEILVFLRKTDVVEAYNMVDSSSGAFLGSHDQVNKKVWLLNGYGNGLIWKDNLWTLAPREEVKKELSIMKVSETEIEKLLVLGDEPDTRRAFPAELLLSTIKVLARNKK